MATLDDEGFPDVLRLVARSTDDAVQSQTIQGDMLRLAADRIEALTKPGDETEG